MNPASYRGLSWVICVLALTLVACAVAPKTPRQYFAATYNLIIATGDSLATLAEARKISRETALDGVTKLESAKALTDEGRKIMACRDAVAAGVDADVKCGPASLADTRVSVARGIINQVQAVIGRAQ